MAATGVSLTRCWLLGYCIRTFAIVQLWPLMGEDYCQGVMRSYLVCVFCSIDPDYFHVCSALQLH